MTFNTTVKIALCRVGSETWPLISSSKTNMDKNTETAGQLTELLQGIVLFLLSPSPAATTELPPTPTPTPSAPSFRERNEGVTVCLSLAGDRCCCRSRDVWHQVLWNVFHVRLHSSGMQWLVVLQVLKIIWVVLKVSLQPPHKSCSAVSARIYKVDTGSKACDAPLAYQKSRAPA